MWLTKTVNPANAAAVTEEFDAATVMDAVADLRSGKAH